MMFINFHNYFLLIFPNRYLIYGEDSSVLSSARLYQLPIILSENLHLMLICFSVGDMICLCVLRSTRIFVIHFILIHLLTYNTMLPEERDISHERKKNVSCLLRSSRIASPSLFFQTSVLKCK